MIEPWEFHMEQPSYAESRDGFKIEIAGEDFWYRITDASGACIEVSGLSRAYEVFDVGHFSAGDLHWFSPRCNNPQHGQCELLKLR